MKEQFKQEKKLAAVFLFFFLSAILVPIMFLVRVGLDSFVQKRNLLQREAFDRHAESGRELDQAHASYNQLLRDIGADFFSDRSMSRFAGAQDTRLWFNNNKKFFKKAAHNDSLRKLEPEKQIRLRYLRQLNALRDKVWSFFTDNIDGFDQANSPLRLQVWVFERSLYYPDFPRRGTAADFSDFRINYGRIYNQDFSDKSVPGDNEDDVMISLQPFLEFNPKLVLWAGYLPSHPVFFDTNDFIVLLWDLLHTQFYKIMRAMVLGEDITQPNLYQINSLFQMDMFSHRSVYFAADLLSLISAEVLWELSPSDFDYDLYRFGLPEENPLEMPEALQVAILETSLMDRFFLDNFTDEAGWDQEKFNSLFQYETLFQNKSGNEEILRHLWFCTQFNLGLALINERLDQSLERIKKRKGLPDRIRTLFTDDELLPFQEKLAAVELEIEQWGHFSTGAEELLRLIDEIRSSLSDWRLLLNSDAFSEIEQQFTVLKQSLEKWMLLPGVKPYSDVLVNTLDEFLRSWGLFLQQNRIFLQQQEFDSALENRISGLMSRILRSRSDRWIYWRKGEMLFWREGLAELKQVLDNNSVCLDLLDYTKMVTDSQISLSSSTSFIRSLFVPVGLEETDADSLHPSHFVSEDGKYTQITELKKTLNAHTGEYSIGAEHLADYLSAELGVAEREISLSVDSLIPLMQKHKRAVHFTYERSGVGMLGSIYPSERMKGKCYFFYQSEDELIARIIRQRNMVFFLALFAVLAALVLGWNLSHLVVRPIVSLKEVVEKFGSRQSRKQASYNRFKGNEIDELKYYFNRMVDNIRDKLFRMEMVRKLHEALNLPAYIHVILNDLKSSYPEALSCEEVSEDPKSLSVRVIRRVLLHYLITSLCCRYQAKYGIMGFFEQGLSNKMSDYAIFDIADSPVSEQEKILSVLVHRFFPAEEERFEGKDGEMVRHFSAEELAAAGIRGDDAVLFISRHFMKDYAITINGVLLVIDPGSRISAEAEKAENLERTLEAVENLCAQAGTVIVKTYLEEIDADAKKGWEIQESLMPSGEPDTCGCLEVESVYIPSPQRLAGDYYDFLHFSLDKRFFGCTIADVSGKGIGASLFGSSSRAFMKIIPEDPTDTAKAITLLNENLCKISDIIKNETAQGLFLTMFYLVIDLQTLTMYYSSGGHNQMFLQRADGSIEELGAKGLPLGMFCMGRYEAKSLQLEPGDSIILYTDGVTEMEAPDQELYGDDRFKNFCLQNEALSCREWTALLNEELSRHRNGVLPTDDVTFIRLRIRQRLGVCDEQSEE
jgi:sigma-B regulation protein RsbU (phosphoserine phosphatase)